MSKQATYKELRATYKDGIPCPADFSFPSNVIDKWANDPTLLAIHWVAHDHSYERKITYAELSDLTNRAAVVFSNLGIKKGSRVMIQIPRVVEWWVAFFGLMRLGAIPIPGTELLVAKDLKFRAAAANAVAFIGDNSATTKFEEIAKEVGISTIIQVRVDGDGGLGKGRVDLQASISAIPVRTLASPAIIHRSNDLAIMFFTSGTTGMPKQVLLENEYTLGHMVTGNWYRLKPGKLFYSLSDGGWAKGSWSTLGCFNLGGALFVQPPAPGPFNPFSILDSLHRYPITTLCCPPTIYRAICSTAGLDYYRVNRPIALEHAVGAGEPLNPSVIRDFLSVSGITLCDGFGQTESILLAGNFYGEDVRPGSMGKAAPGITLAILGPKGVLPLGEEGELCVRSDLGGGKKWLFQGYLRDGKLDSRRVTINGATYYSTGDRAFEDVDGYFWFVGRDDDVISSSGYRIGPFEVESALKEHPAVAESAAVASPHASRGEIVKAFIILTPEYKQLLAGRGPEAEAKLILEIQEHCKVFAAPYKYPRDIEFVVDLPKTVSGKIRRVELRNAEYEKHADVVKVLKSKL